MSVNSNLISVNAVLPTPEGSFFGNVPPTNTSGFTAGDMYYVTPLGTQADAANATESYRFDGQSWIKTPMPSLLPTGQNVYIDTEDPATATIFDTENPPVTNDQLLAEDSQNTFYGTDGSVWTWNGTDYITKVYNFATEHYEKTIGTANQTTYTLPKLPIGRVQVTRNGVEISGSWTWVGAVGTYDPVENFGCTIDANDLLQFSFEAY